MSKVENAAEEYCIDNELKGRTIFIDGALWHKSEVKKLIEERMKNTPNKDLWHELDFILSEIDEI